jgi:predicted ATPase
MKPQGIELLAVKDFKTFADAAVELGSCNVLIGGNGAGKSNFLSLLRMLRALARGEFQLFVERSGRANDVLHRAVPATKELDVNVHLRTAAGKSGYRLLAERTDDNRLLIRQEEIEHFDANGQSLGTEGHPNRLRESMLSEAAHLPGEPMLFPAMQLLTGVRLFHFTETATTAPAAFECDLDDNRELREDGGNLAAYLFSLAQLHPAAYRRIVATVKQALADFGDFVLQPSAQNPPRIRLRWRQKGTEGDLGAHLLSDGTLRFILLTTLLSQPAEQLPAIIATDEPELGLHPAALNLVVSQLRVASRHCQVIVATQSAALVDCFEPEDVIVVHRQHGASTLERLSSAPLREWLAEYSLGELWEKNVFGGGPFG